MKRVFALLFITLVLMLGMSMAAFAQDQSLIVFTDNPGPESLMPSGNGDGIYTGTLNGVTTSFICDDDNHYIGNPTGTNPSTWYVNLWNLTNVATIGNGMYAGRPSGPNASAYTTASGAPDVLTGLAAPTIQQDYNMAAYLANLLLTQTYTDSSDVNAIQWAIWDIMDTPTAKGIGDPGGGANWVTNAYNNGLNYTNSSIVFY